MEFVLYAYRSDPAALIARCRELGVRQVCLLLQGMYGYAETGVPEPRALRARAQTLADEGISLSSGNGSTGRNPELLTNPGGHRKELDAQLRTLESLGGAGIGALLYYQHFPYPVAPPDHARYWDGLIANTHELVAQAEATNVRLAHHAVWRCLPPVCRDDALGRGTTMEGYPDYRHEQWDGPYLLSSHLDVARLIDAVPSSHNGVCFCTGMHIMGGDVPALVETFKGRIHHAQMRDVRGRWPFAREVFLGDGEIDFSTILRLLKGASYDGVIGPEHLGEPRWPGDDPEAAAIAFLRQHIPDEQTV
jgi:sugar phosphate isomerase/epimerase